MKIAKRSIALFVSLPLLAGAAISARADTPKSPAKTPAAKAPAQPSKPVLPLPTGDETFGKLVKFRAWSKAAGPAVTLFYEPGKIAYSSLGPTDNDAATVALKQKGFEWALDKVCGVLQVPKPSFEVPVFLFPDPESLGKAFDEPSFAGSSCQQMTVTFNDGPWPAAGQTGKMNDLRCRAVHEFAHLMVGNQIQHNQGQLPSIFEEGMACWVQTRVPEIPFMHGKLEAFTTIRLADLLDEPDSEDLEDRGLNMHGAAFFDYLYRRDNSMAKVKAFIVAVSTAKGEPEYRAEQASLAVYGKSLDALEGDWRTADHLAAAIPSPVKFKAIYNWDAPTIPYPGTEDAAAKREAKPAPEGDERNIDRTVLYEGKPSVRLKTTSTVRRSVTFKQIFQADKYRGKRVRFSAYVKCNAVTDIAGLLIETQDSDCFRLFPAEGGPAHIADQMQGHWLHGTNDWKKTEVVIDVPQNAAFILIGGYVSRAGEIWFGGMRFEAVDPSTPTTNGDLPASLLDKMKKADEALLKKRIDQGRNDEYRSTLKELHSQAPPEPSNLDLTGKD